MSGSQPVSFFCKGEGILELPVPKPSEWYYLEMLIRPKPKQRAQGRGVVTDDGRSFWQSFTPVETVFFEKQVRLLALQSNIPYWVNGPVGLACYFSLPRQSDLKDDHAHPNYLWMPSQPDKDNLEKSVSDALNLVVVRDDEQICFGAQWKMWAPIGSLPSVRIYVFPLENAIKGVRSHHAELLADTINKLNSSRRRIENKKIKSELKKAARRSVSGRVIVLRKKIK